MDPECAPARWHSGFVRLDGEWLTLAEMQSTFAADPSLAEYRQVRESLAESPLRELLLARWCDEKKLTDEARFHGLNVLRIEPLNQEALQTLGVQWYNGLLLTRDQVAEQKRRDFKASRNTINPRSARIGRWESRIAKWEVAAGRGDSSLLVTMEADLAAESTHRATKPTLRLSGGGLSSWLHAGGTPHDSRAPAGSRECSIMARVNPGRPGPEGGRKKERCEEGCAGV